jgi:hypothetical protein
MQTSATLIERKELAKLHGMTQWFTSREIDEMQIRLNNAVLEILRWRNDRP